MFAPQHSHPPFFPSYRPPDPEQLAALLKRPKQTLQFHGMGSHNEHWKIQHGVYFNAEKTATLQNSDIEKQYKHFQSLLASQIYLSGDAKKKKKQSHRLWNVKKKEKKEEEFDLVANYQASKHAADAAYDIHPTHSDILAPTVVPSPVHDPHLTFEKLESTHVYLNSIARTDVHHIAYLRNTPFYRHLLYECYIVDIGRVEDDFFDIAMNFLSQAPYLHTVILYDTWHQTNNKYNNPYPIYSNLFPPKKNPAVDEESSEGGSESSGGPVYSKIALLQAYLSSPLSRQFATRGLMSRDRGDVMGGNAANGRKMKIKAFPDEKKVLDALESHLPQCLQRNTATLLHIELNHIIITNWSALFQAISGCIHLQRLQLRQCNLTDSLCQELCLVLRQLNLQHLVLSSCHLSSSSIYAICRYVQKQNEARNMLHFQNYLRASDVPPPSPSILTANNLASTGLLSLDLSHNNIGDHGINLLAGLLIYDTWLKALDVSYCGITEAGMKSVVQLLTENSCLLLVHVHGNRAHPTPSPTAELLHRLDPHAEKRRRRLLLLLRQQQLAYESFKNADDLAYSRFFRPNPPTRAGEEEGAGEHHSPHRQIAKDRQSKAQARRPASAPLARVLTSTPAPPAQPLQFLFPMFALSVAPNKMLIPDTSLRAKPQRVNNRWSKKKKRSGSRGRKGEEEKEQTLSVQDALYESHLDFRPCIFDSCVWSTHEYIVNEKKKYKEKLLAAEAAGAGETAGKTSASAAPSSAYATPAQSSSFLSPSSSSASVSTAVAASPLSPRSQYSVQTLLALIEQMETQLQRLQHQHEQPLSSSSSTSSSAPPPAAAMPAKGALIARLSAENAQLKASLRALRLSSSSRTSAPSSAGTGGGVGGGMNVDREVQNLEQQFFKLNMYLELLERLPAHAASALHSAEALQSDQLPQSRAGISSIAPAPVQAQIHDNDRQDWTVSSSDQSSLALESVDVRALQQDFATIRARVAEMVDSGDESEQESEQEQEEEED